MEPQDKYSFSPAPEWAKPFNDDEIVRIIQSAEAETLVQETKKQKDVCHIYKQVLQTSNQKNESYVFRSWSILQPESLQGASVQEFSLAYHETIQIHRLAVLRDGAIVDKIPNTAVNVFDDENSSSSGSINKYKKVNFIISDLRLSDIIIIEHSIISDLSTEKKVVDRSFYRYLKVLPVGYWLYAQYTFQFLQNREESVQIAQVYFRDENGKKIETPVKVLQKGEQFNFEKKNFYPEEQKDIYGPLFEISTVARWEDVSTYVSNLYSKALQKSAPINLIQTAGISLVGDLPNKIRTLIEFVQDTIIYLYNSEEMHGIIPQRSEETLEHKSGDCKAKAVLLKDLLSEIGVESTIIIVDYSGDRFIAESLPSPFCFSHVILKVEYEGKSYFVDPTWSNKKGFLPYRQEPVFSTYLPIKENSNLQKREEIPPATFNVDETALFTLTKDTGRIEMDLLYRRDSADIVRGNFRSMDTNQSRQRHEADVADRLCIPADIDVSDIFTNAEYKIVSDDVDKNELKVIYKADIHQFYSSDNKDLVFRYYIPLRVDTIINFRHKDANLESFIMYPVKYNVTINSKVPYKFYGKVTRQVLELSNNYFSFSNKKKFKFRTINATFSYTPKTYGIVKPEDIESFKSDIRKIKDSYFGIGVIYFASYKWVYIILAIIIWVAVVYLRFFMR